jgi:hypothetical protein
MQICTAVVAEMLYMHKWMDRKRAKIKTGIAQGCEHT